MEFKDLIDKYEDQLIKNPSQIRNVLVNFYIEINDLQKQCDIPIVIESLVCPNGCVKDFNNIGDGLVECKECSCVQQTNVL